jgi:DNA polymerase-3 subunit beta
MKLIVKKEDLYNGIKIVERATSVKALQPVLLNILIETVDKGTIKLRATDLDMTVTALVDAQVEEDGSITIPSRTLGEIVAKIGDGKLINIEVKEGETQVGITCQNSKFDIFGISATEFPADLADVKTDEENGFEIELKPFVKAVKQAGFAAASYETSNLLSGIVCEINDGVLEIASTDGNRLARVREKIKGSNKTEQLIIPSKALNEFIKMNSFIGEDAVKIYKEKSKIIIKSERTTTTSRLLEGQFPKYNQLIPQESPKEAIVNVSQLTSALDRVSVMVNEKTSIVKLEFSENSLKLTADTPDSGKSEDSFDIDYKGEELAIAFNYKYVLEALKNITSDEVKIGLNTSLSATVFRPNSEEDLICLIMPVQIRS